MTRARNILYTHTPTIFLSLIVFLGSVFFHNVSRAKNNQKTHTYRQYMDKY